MTQQACDRELYLAKVVLKQISWMSWDFQMRGTPPRVMTYPRHNLVLDLLASGSLLNNDTKSALT
jgi:hypothetical protein